MVGIFFVFLFFSFTCLLFAAFAFESSGSIYKRYRVILKVEQETWICTSVSLTTSTLPLATKRGDSRLHFGRSAFRKIERQFVLWFCLREVGNKKFYGSCYSNNASGAGDSRNSRILLSVSNAILAFRAILVFSSYFRRLSAPTPKVNTEEHTQLSSLLTYMAQPRGLGGEPRVTFKT